MQINPTMRALPRSLAAIERLPSPAPFTWKYAFALALFSLIIAAYLSVGHATLGHQRDFMTTLDGRIPYLPWTIWVYLPLYALFFHAAIWSIRSWDVFFRGMTSLVLASLLAEAIFLLVPAEYPRPPIPADGSMTASLLQLLRTIDPPTNTFPSLHVGFTVTAALACWRDDPRRGRWMGLVACFPCVSILTVKQHFVVDLLGGLVIALVAHAAAFGVERPRDVRPSA